MSSTIVIILIVIAVLVVGLIAFLIIRRQRYVRALRGRGWTFESRPSLDWVLDHHAPPFGLGFVRKVDEAISGQTAAGVPFRVFEYTSSEGGPKFDDRVASVQLPLPLPDLFVSTDHARSGVELPQVEVDPRYQVRAADAGYAGTALSASVLDAIAAFGQAGHKVDLSIDGQQLVAVGTPKDPEQLQGYLEKLGAVAQAFDPGALAPYRVTPPTPGFGFYGHPDWQLIGRDDTLIAKYDLTTAGFGHTTEKVIRGSNDGLPIEAFIHRWKTRRTETYTDSNGHTQTRTVTENHSEVVTAIMMPFSVPMLSVGGGWGGKKVRFESEEFNDRFTVRTDNPKFASDVIHPRTMEFLMVAQPPGFRIAGNGMRFSVDKHDTQLIGFCADFAHEFLGRVPSFVWKNLQITPPTFRQMPRD
ncbi:MAG TPA: hypothetical protein VI036_00470 [Propionibacteriaceae bacterium]